MDYEYSRYKVPDEEKILERFLEILPGALSWSIIVGLSVLSFVRPMIASVIMIAFLLYWLLRLIYMNIFLVVSYLRLAKEKDIDWMERIKKLDNSNGNYPNSNDIYHVVIVPVINERGSVIGAGIKALESGDYLLKKVILIIALEEVAPDDVKKDVMELQEEYKELFFNFMVVTHPANLPGEIRTKSANTTYAAKKAAEFLRENNIPYENVIVSDFDADAIPSRNYLNCLTYHFMITPDRTRTGFQPIPLFHNNIWEVPPFARILDIGTSFFQLVEATNPEKLVTFSSYSMSFKALVEAGYWQVDMIPEDSGIFWKAFIRFDGKYHVVPIYTTVSMDIATGPTLAKTLLNIYKQKRRWAWGIENFPLVIRAFLKSKTIPLYKKISYGYKLLDSFISWATWSFLLAFVSWLPAALASSEFASSTVYHTIPRINGIIFRLAFSGIVVCSVISLLLLPAKKKGARLWEQAGHVLEWLFIPLIIVVLSALPALDAQTRLMFGKKLEYWVAQKRRGKNTNEP